MKDRAGSAAFAALGKTARRMLAVIEKAAGNGGVEISYATLMHDHRFGRPSISASLKTLDCLGLVDVSRGRLGNCYSLSDRWRTIDASQAATLARQARQTLPSRRFVRATVDPVEPVEVEVVQVIETDGDDDQGAPPPDVRTPSLPVLRWLDAR
jgi:hypothetical protein